MAVKKFNEWITEQEQVPAMANQMQPGGHTQMAGQPPALGNAATGHEQEDQQAEEETKHISQSIMTLLDRLTPKLTQMKNKQAGMEVVAMILDKIHTAFPQITQAAFMKLVKGTMQPQAPNPHMPPMPQGMPQQGMPGQPSM